MNKYLFILATLFLAGTTCSAQDNTFKIGKVLKEVKGNLKDKKYAQADAAIKAAWASSPEAQTHPALYAYELDALQELILEENKKMYLSNKADTVKFFDYMLQTYNYGLKLDSMDTHPTRDAKGRIQPAAYKYHKTVQQKLLKLRKNLSAAGKFHYRKKQYGDAYKYFSMYIGTKNSNVFKDKNGASILPAENDMTDMSVLAMLSAYGAERYAYAVQYYANALADTASAEKIYEIGYKSYFNITDTLTGVKILKAAANAYPSNKLFFSELTKYYNSKGNYEAAIALARKMTECDASNRDYWYVLGKELEYDGKEDEAIKMFGKACELQDADYESYSALGNIYLRKAQEAYSAFHLSLSDPGYKKGKQAIDGIYSQAGQYFELARKHKADSPDLWLEGLKEVYFKLNKGKELKELERI